MAADLAELPPGHGQPAADPVIDLIAVPPRFSFRRTASAFASADSLTLAQFRGRHFMLVDGKWQSAGDEDAVLPIPRDSSVVRSSLIR